MTENKNVLRVLNGFLELSTSEKMELKGEIESAIIEGVLNSEHTNMVKKTQIKVRMSANIGPTNSGNCKCCGKG
jgi:hypothetical protein